MRECGTVCVSFTTLFNAWADEMTCCISILDIFLWHFHLFPFSLSFSLSTRILRIAGTMYGIGTVSNHPKHNHSFMYCCCWQFLITSTHFFLSFISGIIVIIGFVISVNFLSRYCLPLVLLCKFILQIESHTFSFPFIPFCILKLFPFVIGIMQYGFFVVCVSCCCHFATRHCRFQLHYVGI